MEQRCIGMGVEKTAFLRANPKLFEDIQDIILSLL
jgi:hypothetical protein